jgi:hypothetical protein
MSVAGSTSTVDDSEATGETQVVHSRSTESTTVKVSKATRGRIRALGGDTHEDTIVEALDALESNRF